MTKFEAAEDGQYANIEFVTLTPSATEKVESNAVYVSPVIFPSWKDGSGQTYTDVITHMDLVNHPVDHSQGPAQPIAQPALMSCIRMGTDTKPYKMSDDESPEMPESMESIGEDSEESEGSQSMLPSVLTALASFGLVLPEDTTEDNFVDRIYTAAIAAAGADPMAGGMNPPGETTPTQQQGLTVSQPQIATMSLEAQRALEYGERQHKANVQSQLDALLESGRCTPAEHNNQKQLVGTLKLSLDDQASQFNRRLSRGSSRDKQFQPERSGMAKKS